MLLYLSIVHRALDPLPQEMDPFISFDLSVACGTGKVVYMNGIPKEVSLPVLRSVPDFSPGDTVKVHVNIVEGNRKRIQVFMGVVIARKGTGISETFTVRKISFGVGVERVFPLHCPTIDKIEIASRGKVRRAKLYYLRTLKGRAAKIKEKRDF